MADVTQILSQIEQGDPSAAEQLLPLVDSELRKLVDKDATTIVEGAGSKDDIQGRIAAIRREIRRGRRRGRHRDLRFEDLGDTGGLSDLFSSIFDFGKRTARKPRITTARLMVMVLVPDP